MINAKQDKRRFYNQSQVARGYDQLRFGGASGAWVNTRETELALALLPATGSVLDLGCGTGRLLQRLGARAMGLDAASAMLNEARKAGTNSLVRGDAFNLPLATASFDAVVSLRLLFHFREIEDLLAEMSRICKPGGAIVFDTYLWSPRALLPLDSRRWGGGVFAHSIPHVECIARSLGPRVVAHETCFLFSPYLYRRLPLRVVHSLDRLEKRLPARLHARVFWKMVKPE